MNPTAGGRRDAVDGLAAAMMIGLTFSWGLNSVATKIATLGYDPIFLTIARSAIAAALVFVWCRWRDIALFQPDGTLVGGLAAGALFGAEFVMLFVGFDFTSVARGTLMVNTMPFWVLVGGHFWLGEHMTLRKWLGLVLAFAGVVLVFSDRLSLAGPDALFGDLLCLAAGVVWAATTIVIRRSRLATAAPEKTLLYQLSVSAVVALPLLLFTGPAIRSAAPLATAALLFQAVYVVAFTYVLWFWLVRTYPAAGLSSFAFLSPVFAVLLGGLVLNEPITWQIGAALALITAGIVVVNLPARRGTPA